MKPRDPQQSYPIVDSRDEPNAISPADFEAHLQAHRLLEQRLKSDPVRLKAPNGLVVSGSGRYIVILAALALVAFVCWLWLR